MQTITLTKGADPVDINVDNITAYCKTSAAATTDVWMKGFTLAAPMIVAETFAQVRTKIGTTATSR